MQPNYSFLIKYGMPSWKLIQRLLPKQGFCNHSGTQKVQEKQITLQLANSEETKAFSVVSFLSDPYVQQLLEPYGNDYVIQESEVPEELKEEWSTQLDTLSKKLGSCKLEGKDRVQLRVKLIRKLQDATGIVLPSDAYHNLRNKKVIDVVAWYERIHREQLYHNSMIEDYIRKTFPSNVRLDPVSYRKSERRMTDSK
ncbi:hypothetical protein Gasu2_48560 [Galdieria sulphuraria]|uniref:Uncharacterized protein n=1 Tax=Galdieria sulphuraria TaxID=130081 RepID=M2XYG0_GALSU|nr:uncharacterized protein Gasu_38960 [Galdieria sulphuraria]EME28688.1 hypothetical protein Gasu_38960 [Galdieria sulphuraria]GJD10677.1 hypothetical protein Gasu2_48560 [Galdieria sulphuraria]|eukprot:XP_005705208.1 hypothetical protein Gasu_38960 [Galdieria sulphuraria]